MSKYKTPDKFRQHYERKGTETLTFSVVGFIGTNITFVCFLIYVSD